MLANNNNRSKCEIISDNCQEREARRVHKGRLEEVKLELILWEDRSQLGMWWRGRRVIQKEGAACEKVLWQERAWPERLEHRA